MVFIICKEGVISFPRIQFITDWYLVTRVLVPHCYELFQVPNNSLRKRVQTHFPIPQVRYLLTPRHLPCRLIHARQEHVLRQQKDVLYESECRCDAHNTADEVLEKPLRKHIFFLKCNSPRLRNVCKRCYEIEEQEHDKEEVVLEPDARPEPRAVVVPPQHALAARFAVRSPQRRAAPARFAEKRGFAAAQHRALVIAFDVSGPSAAQAEVENCSEVRHDKHCRARGQSNGSAVDGAHAEADKVEQIPQSDLKLPHRSVRSAQVKCHFWAKSAPIWYFAREICTIFGG